MNEKPTNEEKCPHCGFINGQDQGEHYYLPEGAKLNDRYVVGRVLGHGGFGITYIGLDTKLDTRVAIKEYLPSDISTRALGETTVSTFSGDKYDAYVYGLGRFIDEAKTLAKYNAHQCIVSINDYFEENNTAYIVMEYLDGISLAQYLKRSNGRISYEETLEIMSPVIDALREVHSHGMIHRDVSPDNIFITKDKQIKLLDFGAARHAMGEKSKSLSVVLKPGYAPPEQYYTKGRQGAWTDIYAVAATMFKCLTGDNPPEAMERMSEEDDNFLSKLDFLQNKQIKDVIGKALSLRTEDRFQNVMRFYDYLTNKAKIPVQPEPAKTTAYRQPQENPYGQINNQINKSSRTASTEGSKKKSFAIIGIVAASILILIIAISSGNNSSNKSSYSGSSYNQVNENDSYSYEDNSNNDYEDEPEVHEEVAAAYEEVPSSYDSEYGAGELMYTGYIDTGSKQVNIHMWLTFNDWEDIDGRYYYDKHEKYITLSGYDYDEIVLSEYSDGEHTGTFILQRRGSGGFIGIWTDDTGEDVYDVVLDLG